MGNFVTALSRLGGRRVNVPQKSVSVNFILVRNVVLLTVSLLLHDIKSLPMILLSEDTCLHSL
jgi:hypothetical protein